MASSSESGPGPSAGSTTGRYAWLAPGDVNAFFGLMLDNVGVMILMAGLLVGAYGFPASFVVTRMIPGTAIGVLVGDLIYTAMAFGLARRTGRRDVTAMPLGLDTPSTFGSVFLILGPSFLKAQASQGPGADPVLSAAHAWYVGMGVLLASGVFKLVCAPFSGWIRRVVPRAGLLGSLVAIALVIISFLPLLEIAATPVAGLVALFLTLATLTAHWQTVGRGAWLATVLGVGFIATFLIRYPPSPFGLLPALLVATLVAGVFGYLLYRAGQVPGALMAVVLGSAVYYAMHAMGLGPGPGPRPDLLASWSLPLPFRSWLTWAAGNWSEVAAFLPVAIPLAVATVVGGIDCAESAAAAGDDYSTSKIIAAEGFSTLVAALFGGVIQSTPYIGHPAYKAMGGRAGYTLATALFVGAAGVLGIFGWIFHVLPKAAVYPILVFVGIEITQQSFRATPRRHYPALALACLPALAYLVFLMVDRLAGEVDHVFGHGGSAIGALSPEIRQWLQVITVLAAGFIVTSLIWGTALARLIDGRWRTSAAVLGLAALFSLFGVIHSPLRGSPIAWPGHVVAELEHMGRLGDAANLTPYHWTAAYLAAAAVVVLIGGFGKPGTPAPDPIPHGPEEPGAG